MFVNKGLNNFLEQIQMYTNYTQSLYTFQAICTNMKVIIEIQSAHLKLGD